MKKNIISVLKNDRKFHNKLTEFLVKEDVDAINEMIEITGVSMIPVNLISYASKLNLFIPKFSRKFLVTIRSFYSAIQSQYKFVIRLLTEGNTSKEIIIDMLKRNQKQIEDVMSMLDKKIKEFDQGLK